MSDASSMADKDFLRQMGFSEYSINNAIERFPGSSMEELLSLLLGEGITVEGNSYTENIPFKMVIVVRRDLVMTAGKVASQSAHAALGSVRIVKSIYPDVVRQWEIEGETIIVLGCDGVDELSQIDVAAEVNGISRFVVSDAGRTEVGVGTRTCVALGPAPANLIDSITGSLKLYK